MSGDKDIGPEHWRQKYYNCLEQMEEQENRLGQVEMGLRRNIERLSHVAKSGNEVVDGYLSRLRKSIHDGENNSVLEKIINDVTTIHEQLQKSRSGMAAGSSHPSTQDILSNLLTDINIPGKLSRSADKLGQRIKSSASGADVLELGREISALVNKALIESARGGSHSSGGILGLFRGKTETTKTAAPALDLSPDAAQITIEEVLLQLIERLHMPSDMTAQANEIKARLERTVEQKDLNEVLAMIAGLVSEMRTKVQQERSELEQFLKQLTERLQALDVFIQNSEKMRKASIKDGQELDASVKTQMKGIRTSVEQATDLGELKFTIQNQLDVISQHMQAFVMAEEGRNRKVEQEMESLTSKLSDMEAEATNLRKKVQLEHRQALLDPLTGVGNRLAYNERITQEYARWKRYKTPLTMLVCDLDYFKNINDNFGHKAGDKVLRTVARLLHKSIRETDFISRYGGEEFTILMAETSLETAMQVAEKLRDAIEHCGFHHEKKAVPITISCGVAEFHQNDTPESVFTRADAALYRAKQAGRNRCESE